MSKMREEFHQWLHDHSRDMGLPDSIFIYLSNVEGEGDYNHDEWDYYNHEMLDALWYLWKHLSSRGR